MAKGVKGTYRNLWKDIFVELHSFSHLAHCVVGNGKEMHFWKICWVVDRSLSSMFLHLSFLKNCVVSNFFVPSKILFIFPLVYVNR